MNAMYTMAVGTFVPMLESLSAILDKGAVHAKSEALDLPGARLAPDMFTLAQQVQQACLYAETGVARLTGRGPCEPSEAAPTMAGLKAQVAATLDRVKSASPADFADSETRDCSIDIANGMVIEMDGVRFLKSWTLPHFYFHVVTAYDILRHCGVDIGKNDYLSQVGDFIRPKAA